MHVLFVHNNYPAQFRYLAPRLAADFGWRCTFATRNTTAPDLPGVERVVYRLRSGAVADSHRFTRAFQNEVGHAHAVYEALRDRPDVRPDLVVAHSGFGASLYLPHLYDCPIVNFFEYFRRPVGGCVGYRPEVPLEESDVLGCTTSNAMILLDLHHCDRGWCPNEAQCDAMPKEYRHKIEVIPEGVDTELYKRRGDCGSAGERRLPNGTVIPDGTRVVTYVARGFELARGFDVFMAAARRICEARPDVVFAVAGTDKAYYMADGKVTGGSTLRQRVLEAGNFDLSRFHFLGWLSEEKLVDLLSVGDLHFYLTVPFITSWSMLDAMSCGCVLLASDQACTREYITDGVNGLLCDFFDDGALARRALEVLDDPQAYRHLGDAARRTIEERYSLDVCLPRIKRFFEETAALGPRTPSVRAEALVRPATAAWWGVRPKREGEAPAEPGVALAPYDGAIPFHAAARGFDNSPSPRPSPPSTGEREKGGKTVLFTWELGAGLGHLMQVLPLATGLARAGHCVVVALRHLDRAANVFGRSGVFYLQAPHLSGQATGGPRFRGAHAYGQFLANLGFGDDDALYAHACAWRNLMRSVGPDLVVCDHSPTALLAARALPDARRAVIGSGFCVPPDEDGRHSRPYEEAGETPAPQVSPHTARPWGVLRPRAVAADPAPALAVEAEVLSRVNWLLEQWGQPAMDRLEQLYADVDETFLTTFPELDHFGVRVGAAYWGPVLCAPEEAGGEAPRWPDRGEGKRVFAYLKATPSAGDVLAALRRMNVPTLAYVDGSTPAQRKRLVGPALHLAEKRLDVSTAARECNVAVLNGGHGVVAEMLLAGKPVLAVPLVLEQQMTGEALRRLGAGESAPPRRGEPWEWAGAAKLEAVLTDEAYAEAARAFARRYAAFDPARQREAMFERAEELLAAGHDAGVGWSNPAAAAIA